MASSEGLEQILYGLLWQVTSGKQHSKLCREGQAPRPTCVYNADWRNRCQTGRGILQADPWATWSVREPGSWESRPSEAGLRGSEWSGDHDRLEWSSDQLFPQQLTDPYLCSAQCRVVEIKLLCIFTFGNNIHGGNLMTTDGLGGPSPLWLPSSSGLSDTQPDAVSVSALAVIPGVYLLGKESGSERCLPTEHVCSLVDVLITLISKGGSWGAWVLTMTFIVKLKYAYER